MSLFEYLKGSLDNQNTGASGKKLTALIVTLTYVYAHRYCTTEILTSVLIVDAGLITALFGINVVDKLKNGDK
jgi:hypothetical protein